MSEQDKKLIKFVTAVTQRLEELSQQTDALIVAMENMDERLDKIGDRLKDLEDFAEPCRVPVDPDVNLMGQDDVQKKDMRWDQATGKLI